MNRSGRRRLAGQRAWLFALFALLLGCKSRESRSGPPEQTEPVATSVAAASAAQSAAVTATATAGPKPSAGATASASANPAEGIWEGTYNAKKGSVVLPPKVKDPVREKDDGKAATGPGTVTLTIGASGELRGTAQGALGAATLVGTVEDDMIRASVSPDDPRAPSAMTGVLLGKLKDGVIRAELRAAGRDATVVRESLVELKRK